MATIKPVTLQGGDRAYQVCFDTNAWCRLEEATGRPYPELVRQLLSDGPLPGKLVLQFLQAGLVDPPNASMDDVGLIVDDLGGLGVVTAGLRSGATNKPAAPAPVAAANA